MHVIALALAHLDDNPAPHLAPVLFRGSAREVLQRVAGQAHVGFKGVLRRLPSAVLSRQGYLRLIELLDDPLCCESVCITSNRGRSLIQLSAYCTRRRRY